MVTAFVVLVIFLATAVTLLTAVVVADDTGYLQYGSFLFVLPVSIIVCFPLLCYYFVSSLSFVRRSPS
jgi:hypothetical protein